MQNTQIYSLFNEGVQVTLSYIHGPMNSSLFRVIFLLFIFSGLSGFVSLVCPHDISSLKDGIMQTNSLTPGDEL